MPNKIEHIHVYGVEDAFRGMRNPLNSHDKSTVESDYELSRKLTKAGSEHAKHLRMIMVTFDLTAPRYFWSEFDTYKFNTKISESTMHTIHKRHLTYDDFEEQDVSYQTLQELNVLIDWFNQAKEHRDKTRVTIKRRLPEGFLQKRTISTNFAELLSMYNQRKNHKLPIWKWLCSEILEIPNFKEITGVENGKS